MKLTLSWLKKHLETNASLNDIVLKLTALGLEVEEVTNRADQLKGFTIAQIKEIRRHPEADRLNLCLVNTGSEEYEVVCGASNVQKGMKAVFAREGMYIPGSNMTLKKTKIRGVESTGMLCSEEELCLSLESEGIIHLPDDAPIGAEFVSYAGLDDPMIEIGLTPDRSDCAGIRGIARDLAAAGLGTLIDEKIETVKGTFQSPIQVKIADDAKGAVQLFAGRVIKGVKNGESPEWLKRDLESIGVKPISVLVDITNYMTFDAARPMHVFDAAKIKGDLILKSAQKGEAFKALNDKEYELKGGEIGIYDDSGFQSLAGIIGGANTGCSFDTVDVFLECALFEPSAIAYAARGLAIESDARYRFERGVDPASVEPYMEKATQMILDLCGGEASDVILVGNGVPADHQRKIAYEPSYCAKLIGLDVPEGRQKEILNALGFVVSEQNNTWIVQTPTWRYDVNGKADIAEEVVRVIGFDHIPARSFVKDHPITQPALDASQRRRQRVRRLLASEGLHEAVTWSFMSESLAKEFAPIPDSLKLLNPISADLDVMRPSIIGNLLLALKKNTDRSYRDFGMFELGPVFDEKAPLGQHQMVAGVRSGLMETRNVHGKERLVDLYDAKADCYAILEDCGLDPQRVQVRADEAPSYYHPTRSAKLALGNQVLGYFGELHPALLQTCGIKEVVVAFEIYIDLLPLVKEKAQKPALQLNQLQFVERDFAFLVNKAVSADQVISAVRKADKKYLQKVTLFDIYEGVGVEEGHQSVALSVTLQPVEKSFTDEEIEAISQSIIQSVLKETGASLRS